MPYALVNGLRVFYQQLGAGPDVVLVHGLAANHAFWFSQVALSLRRHFRVTVYDLRGHGYSDMPAAGYSVTDLATDLAALLDHLDIPRAILIGHSYGGHVAFYFAMRTPQRVTGLVIADSRIYALQPQQRLRDATPVSALEAAVLHGMNGAEDEEHIGLRILEELAGEHTHPLPVSAPGDTRQAPVFMPFTLGGKNTQRAAARWRHLVHRTSLKQDVRHCPDIDDAHLNGLDIPLLAVYGELSRCLPTCRALQQRLPHCRVHIIENAGHFHPYTRPRYFVSAVENFLGTLAY